MRSGRCWPASARWSFPREFTGSTPSSLTAVPTRPLPHASIGRSRKHRRSSVMSRGESRLGIYYEHPDWYRPLFAELDRRGVAYDALQADAHHYDPSERESPYAVVFNRMSPSAYIRGRGHLTFYTQQYLAHLERLGVRVINGAQAWRTEVSKAYQLSILEELGLPYPRARVIHDPSQAGDAARGLQFPVVVKPNIGGSGAGIVRFDTPDALARAAASGTLALGLDSTALVQEYVPARDGRIVRV